MVLISGMMVLLYVVKMIFDHFTNFTGEFGHISLYIRSGSMFPSAPVSTFASILAGIFFTSSNWDFYFCYNIRTAIKITYFVEFEYIIITIISVIVFCINIFILSPLVVFKLISLPC